MPAPFWSFRIQLVTPGIRVRFGLQEPWLTELASFNICDMEIRADPDNQGFVVIGDDQVIAAKGAIKGIFLGPGERMEIGSADVNTVVSAHEVFLDGRFAGDAVGGTFIELNLP